MSRNMGKRWFYCPCCRSTMMAPKNNKHMTSKGHKKKLWCWRCKKYVNMIQYA